MQIVCTPSISGIVADRGAQPVSSALQVHWNSRAGSQCVTLLKPGHVLRCCIRKSFITLCVASVKTSFDNTETAVRGYAASLVLLDETLRDYGDAALPARRLVRDYVTMLTDDVWHNPNPSPYLTERRDAGKRSEQGGA